jgi:hypothetical protein
MRGYLSMFRFESQFHAQGALDDRSRRFTMLRVPYSIIPPRGPTPRGSRLLINHLPGCLRRGFGRLNPSAMWSGKQSPDPVSPHPQPGKVAGLDNFSRIVTRSHVECIMQTASIIEVFSTTSWRSSHRAWRGGLTRFHTYVKGCMSQRAPVPLHPPPPRTTSVRAVYLWCRNVVRVP